MWIRKNDTVLVTRGDDKGKRGKVLSVSPTNGKIVVEGMNLVYKHVRKSQRNPQGGRLSVERPFPQSNVALVCGSCSQATRVGARHTADGSKERYCKKCSATVSVVAGPKAAYAKK
jgi:large subunit ribosomal protein L24